MLTQEEKERYSRHLLLKDFGIQAQEKLRNARVLVIGAGGLGCPVLQYLTAAGIGTIGIADPDRVALSNLQRQVLYSSDDISRLKVDAARDRLSALNPEINILTYPERVTSSNADSLISRYDVIVDTTDNIPARYMINDACVRNEKPVVYGAIFRWEGQITVFNYQGGPTYRCLFPDPPGDIVLSCDQEGVVGVVPGIVGSLQAVEVIKLLTGTGAVLSGVLLSMDLCSHLSSKIKFSRRDDQVAKAFQAVNITEVSTGMLDALLQNDEISQVDVRNVSEFEEGNTGGRNIPLHQLDEYIPELLNVSALLFLCQSGRRSLEAIRRIQEAGYSGTCYNLTEGLGPYFLSKSAP